MFLQQLLFVVMTFISFQCHNRVAEEIAIFFCQICSIHEIATPLKIKTFQKLLFRCCCCCNPLFIKFGSKKATSLRFGSSHKTYDQILLMFNLLTSVLTVLKISNLCHTLIFYISCNSDRYMLSKDGRSEIKIYKKHIQAYL